MVQPYITRCLRLRELSLVFQNLPRDRKPNTNVRACVHQKDAMGMPSETEHKNGA